MLHDLVLLYLIDPLIGDDENASTDVQQINRNSRGNVMSVIETMILRSNLQGLWVVLESV